MSSPPVMWSIAGTDSAGGAGLAADQRAADALGVHLCPVVAAVTAQHSRAVTQVAPVAPALLEDQLEALAADLPPRVVKTGLLGSAEHVLAVARWIDRLREGGPVALVVDPVLAASSGRGFADDATLAAYRDALLPRATLVTPNRREAERLLGCAPDAQDAPDAPDAQHAPALARALQAMGARSVAVTGGDGADHDGLVLDWIATPQAEGWLAAPRVATPHHHGTGCTYASAAAAALALGFVSADALVLAKMTTLHALRRSHAAGGGAGPVKAAPLPADPTLLPRLSWGEAPVFADDAAPAPAAPPLGLYAIVDSAARVRQVLAAGVRTVQLRIKSAADLEAEVRNAVAACRAAGATLFVNDHWQLAARCGAVGVHLGQEDLLALGEAGRAALRASGLALGISSHSLWELARANALAPRYLACGPVWPTLTKAMPWRPQGLDNLAWWCAMAGRPVVAIGGLLEAAQFEAAARCGADGACAVRVLGADPAAVVPALQQALAAGRMAKREVVPALPHPSLAGP